MKRALFIIAGIVIVAVAWYLLSPLWNVVERDDTSPLVNDAMHTMDAETKETFERQVQAMENVFTNLDQTMPDSSALLAEGDFKPSAHEVLGTALLINTSTGKILRFEDFETINGPELHIYLASSLGDEDIIDLGIIKATRGNVNYEISSDIDTDTYNKVLVWCKPFRVLFSYAELT